MTIQDYLSGNWTLDGSGSFLVDGAALGVDVITVVCTNGAFTLNYKNNQISLSDVRTQATAVLTGTTTATMQVWLNGSCNYNGFTSFVGSFNGQ